MGADRGQAPPVSDAAIARCGDLLRNSKRPVALTGSGMSAESGIPTFRDADNSLWQRWSPERLASAEGFRDDKALVWGWYAWRMANIANAVPNAGHLALAELEDLCTSLAVITQNVDDLHERAGTQRITHLHGSIFSPRCFACARPFDDYEIPTEAIGNPSLRIVPPTCRHCGGVVRPGVVWFGESLPATEWRQSEQWVRESDLLVVIGTSGAVQPAASLVSLARRIGVSVILIDPGRSEHEALADHHLRMPAGIALPALLERVRSGP